MKLDEVTEEDLKLVNKDNMRPDKLAEALKLLVTEEENDSRQHLRETYPRPLSEKVKTLVNYNLNKEQIKEVIE